MLKATLKNHYYKTNADGVRTGRYVWELSSNSPAELEKFKEDQGPNYRQDDSTGRPLFYSKTYPGKRTGVDVERVTLKDGAIVYRMDAMDQRLKLEDIKLEKQAEFEIAQEFGAQQRAARVAPAAVAQAAEVEVPEVAGGEGLGEPL
jgi:hypothetical protein